jgi:mitochondrial transcription factor 1
LSRKARHSRRAFRKSPSTNSLTELIPFCSFLAPGAEALLKDVTDPHKPPEERLDTKKAPRDMTTQEWAVLLRAFDEWPFAPEDLLITDGLTRDD